MPVPETKGRGLLKFKKKLDEIIAEYKEEDEKVNYILDAVAVLAYLSDEEGAEKVEELLERAESGEIRLFRNCVNLSEVYYIIARELGVAKANEAIAIVKRWNMEFVEVEESIALIVARIKAVHKLSYADALVVATATDKKRVSDRRWRVRWSLSGSGGAQNQK